MAMFQPVNTLVATSFMQWGFSMSNRQKVQLNTDLFLDMPTKNMHSHTKWIKSLLKDMVFKIGKGC